MGVFPEITVRMPTSYRQLFVQNRKAPSTSKQFNSYVPTEVQISVHNHLKTFLTAIISTTNTSPPTTQKKMTSSSAKSGSFPKGPEYDCTGHIYHNQGGRRRLSMWYVVQTLNLTPSYVFGCVSPYYMRTGHKHPSAYYNHSDPLYALTSNR